MQEAVFEYQWKVVQAGSAANAGAGGGCDTPVVAVAVHGNEFYNAEEARILEQIQSLEKAVLRRRAEMDAGVTAGA